MFNHIKSFIRYLFYYEEINFESRLNIFESMSNISNLVKDNTNTLEGEIILSSDEIKLYSTKHIVSGRGGTPMIPIFKGKFIEKDSNVILIGKFSIDSFCKLIIGILFGAIFIGSLETFAFNRWPNIITWIRSAPSSLTGEFFALIILTFLLEIGFWLGKKDIKYISQLLYHTLSKT